jgi:Zn-dependent peptidase ImmA (M78 family)
VRIPIKKDAERIKAAAAAFRILSEFGFPHPREIDLKDLAMDRNVFVREGAIKGAEGRLLRKGKNGVIHIRRGIIPDGRRRFTIAHELGHWELHAAYSQFLCDAEDMRDYGRSPLEVEANCFAAELLMPNSHFRAACGNHEPSMALIETLADDFQTTLTSTAIRFADVSKRRVVIVYYQNNVVRWSYSDPKKKLPFVLAGRCVPDYSSATLDSNEVATEMDHYEEGNWFPELSYGKEDVSEETKRMSNLKGGLTLLWFP